MHTGYDDLVWGPIDPSDPYWRRATVTLGKADTAWNPASTKHVIYGPASVTYERAPDGGITAYVD
jgi:hypothetical protein